jgi:hypothetical protein
MISGLCSLGQYNISMWYQGCVPWTNITSQYDIRTVFLGSIGTLVFAIIDRLNLYIFILALVWYWDILAQGTLVFAIINRLNLYIFILALISYWNVAMWYQGCVPWTNITSQYDIRTVFLGSIQHLNMMSGLIWFKSFINVMCYVILAQGTQPWYHIETYQSKEYMLLCMIEIYVSPDIILRCRMITNDITDIDHIFFQISYQG